MTISSKLKVWLSSLNKIANRSAIIAKFFWFLIWDNLAVVYDKTYKLLAFNNHIVIVVSAEYFISVRIRLRILFVDWDIIYYFFVYIYIQESTLYSVKSISKTIIKSMSIFLNYIYTYSELINKYFYNRNVHDIDVEYFI